MMSLRNLSLLALVATVLLPARVGDGRPGGGSSFRSSSRSSSSSSSYRPSRSSSSSSSYRSSSSSYRPSSSSYRSSSSSYRSSSSSYRSSSSSYRSSSSSSYRSSSVRVPPRPLAPVVIVGQGLAPTVTWRPDGPSVYGATKAASAPLCTVSLQKHGTHPGVWAFLGVVGVGLALVVWAVARRRTPPLPPVAGRSVARQLEVIRQSDPDFSVVLLEDFLYALYAEAHTARGEKALARLAPYLQPEAQRALEALGGGVVSTIVVGAMTFQRFRTDPSLYRLDVELESNYTEAAPVGSQSYYARETWTLARQRAARSRPPERVRVFRCPSCDAPTDQISGRTCGYCGQVVTTGLYEWMVERIVVEERETRGPMLTGTTEEQGTDLPTVVDPSLRSSLTALTQRDPQFSEEGLRARVQLVFQTMQTAWSSLEWERARPFLSDRLHEAQSYWIRAYRAAGLRNVTEAKIKTVEVVRVTSDRWFDAVTVRLHAGGLDYTIRAADNTVVGGSKSRARAYSEYWTLIRSTSRSGPARATPDCPQCGAPLAINMAGRCEHCDAKVNSGEFDWVLSRIEQDETYQG